MTLIECMLALTLSTFMVSCLFEMYLAVENHRSFQDNLISMKENAELISQLMAHHLRNAGYAGCAKLTNDFPINNHLTIDISEKSKIQSDNEKDIKPETDGLLIWHANKLNGLLTQKILNNSVLYVGSKDTFSPNDRLLISDCKQADVITIKKSVLLSDGTQKINSMQKISHVYGKNSEIHRIEQEHFFIGDTGRLNDERQPIYALYEKDNDEHKSELVEGVEALHIELINIENNQVLGQSIKSVTNAEHAAGVSFEFIFPLHHKWYTYVALRSLV